MAGKLGATFFALLFALPFGGVGAFAAYGIVTSLNESRRASDWVLVQAKVDDAELRASHGKKGGTTYSAEGSYRYTLGGREYVSTRLGIDPFGSSDNVGDWNVSMAALLEEAKSSGRTIPVYVNPENPSESVVDRDVRWGMILLIGAFAVVFGGVGLLALGAIVATWIGDGKSAPRERRPRKARKKSGNPVRN
jgi:Protein of unknown function (DUF3592)